MKPRALIACDKFKGSLSAEQACAAVQRGLGDDWKVDFCPIADGGEGFTAAMIAASSGRWIDAPCHDALGRPIIAQYGLIQHDGKTTAVMEMAAASGMWRIAPDERDVTRASTLGTGEMMRHAIEHHAVDRIIMGIGGSATNDGGAGMAAALGVQFHNANHDVLEPNPSSLRQLTRVDLSKRISLPEILVACDVDNLLCGPRGASAIYGPQKGASAEQVIWLDEVLARIATLTQTEAQANTPGAGAAGGLGYGLLAFCHASLQPGFAMVSKALDLEKRVRHSDLVITGEGSLDAQSLSGKGPIGIARLAQHCGKPCIGVAGFISDEVNQAACFAACCDIHSLGNSLEISMAQAAEFLETIVTQHRDHWRSLL